MSIGPDHEDNQSPVSLEILTIVVAIGSSLEIGDTWVPVFGMNIIIPPVAL